MRDANDSVIGCCIQAEAEVEWPARPDSRHPPTGTRDCGRFDGEPPKDYLANVINRFAVTHATTSNPVFVP